MMNPKENVKLVENPLFKQVTQKRFVLYLDIMGFKDRVAKVDIAELRDMLLQFQDKNIKLDPLLYSTRKIKGVTSRKPLLKMSQFSDSIVVVSGGDTLEDLNKILKAGVILMQVGLQTGFALRGALSFGEMVYNDKRQLFFGQALVDAYLIEESLNCYGVVFHESVESQLQKMKESAYFVKDNPQKDKTYLPILNDKLIFKGGKSTHYHLAWYAMKDDLSMGNMTDDAKKWLNNLRSTVSGNPRVYLDNTLALIEEYAEYANNVEKEQQELDDVQGEE